MQQIIIFRDGKYYSYTNNDWFEYDLKSNKPTRVAASPEMVESFNKDINTGRIVFANDKPYIHVPSSASGSKWKLWNDNSKKASKSANKSEQDILDKSIKVQSFAYLTSIREQSKSEASETTKSIRSVISNVSSSQSINSSSNAPSVNISSPAPSVKPSQRNVSSNISSPRQPTANKITNSYEKVKNTLDNSTIVTNNEMSSPNSSAISIFRNIDKNILGMSSTLKTLNKTLISFLDKQKVLEQIAENFNNAKAQDQQTSNKTNALLEKMLNGMNGGNGSEGTGSGSEGSDSGMGIGDLAGAAAGYKMGKGALRKGGKGASAKVPKGGIAKGAAKAGANVAKAGAAASKMGKIGRMTKALMGTPKIGALGAGIASMGLGWLGNKMDESGHGAIGTALGVQSDAMEGLGAGQMVGALTGVPGVGLAVGLGLGGGRIKERLEAKIEKQDWYKSYSRGFRKMFGIRTEEDKTYDTENMSKSEQEKALQKRANIQRFGEPKTRAAELAKSMGIDADPEKIKYKEQNGVVTEIEDNRGNKIPTYKSLTGDEQQYLNDKGQTGAGKDIDAKGYGVRKVAQNTSTPALDKNQPTQFTVDDSKFAAKNPVKFQKFAEYREQQRQNYVNQIPQNLPPQERQVAVQKAEQQAQQDAAKQFETDKPESAQKVPGYKDEPMPSAERSSENPTAERSPRNTQNVEYGQPSKGPLGKWNENMTLADAFSVHESKGNYNIFNQGAGHKYKQGQTDFSKMTVNQVIERQNLGQKDPNKLFAIGKYQIIPETLKDAKSKLKLSGDEKFTPEMQDKIFADYLTKEKRPQIEKFIKSGKGIDAAAKASAQEWASIGADEKGGRSWYDKDGVNKAALSPEKAKQSLQLTRDRYEKAKSQGMSDDDAYRIATTGSDQANQRAKDAIDKQNEMLGAAQNKPMGKAGMPSDERASATMEVQNEMIGSSRLLKEAESNMGKTEDDNEAELRSYIKEGGHSSNQVKGNSNAWCAKYTNAVLGHQGFKGTGKDNARSFLNYGKGVWEKGSEDFSGVKAGDIAVFNRDGGKGGKGHVAIVKSVDPKTGRISYVGGNQGSKGHGGVTTSSASINAKGNELLAIRRPEDMKEGETATKQESNRRPGDTAKMPKGFEPAGPQDENLPNMKDMRGPTQESTQPRPGDTSQVPQGFEPVTPQDQNLPNMQDVKGPTQEASYTPTMPSDLGMRADLPSASGQNLGMGSAAVNNAKDAMSLGGGGGGGSPGASGKPMSGGGGGGASSGGGMADKGNSESGSGIMGIGIGLRHEDSTLTRLQYGIVRIV
jgi:uncharacterized protein (TIGR02594 family)